MKTRIVSITLFLIIVSTTAYTQDTLTILHVNDSHSCIAPLAPRKNNLEGTVGGIARVATIFGLTRMEEKNVLTLHGGDFSMGDLIYNFTYGVQELKLLNAIGLDAMAVGNHEFDLTPSTLNMVLDSAFVTGGFPLLSSNARLEDVSVASLKKYIKQYMIKEYGKIKVGIFSLTTPETNLFSQPYPVFIDTNIVTTAAEMVEKLSSEGCNLVICISHLGVSIDQQLAENIPGINLFVSAHDHFSTLKPIEIKNPSGKTTWIVQADAFYTKVGKLKLELIRDKINLLSYNLIELDENIPEEPAIKQMVSEITAYVENVTQIKLFSEKIGTAENDFTEVAYPVQTGKYETAVGNLVTDAYRTATKTQIAITVGGSTAQKLYKGPITAADIFRMIGYGFNQVDGMGYRIATFKITGEELWKSLEVCLSGAELSDEFLPQVSGMKYDFDLKQNAGSRIRNVVIGEKPIDLNASYTATTNEFLINALPMFGVTITDTVLQNNVTEFGVLYDYIKKAERLDPAKRGMLVGIKNESEGIPSSYKLYQNHPNPFNPSTTISFSLPEAGFTSLSIYNVLGQQVAVLVNANLTAGDYKFNWNAGNFASGIYFYRLVSENYIQIKKMNLLK